MLRFWAGRRQDGETGKRGGGQSGQAIIRDTTCCVSFLSSLWSYLISDVNALLHHHRNRGVDCSLNNIQFLPIQQKRAKRLLALGASRRHDLKTEARLKALITFLTLISNFSVTLCVQSSSGSFGRRQTAVELSTLVRRARLEGRWTATCPWSLRTSCVALMANSFRPRTQYHQDVKSFHCRVRQYGDPSHLHLADLTAPLGARWI